MSYVGGMTDEFQTAIDSLRSAGLIGEISFSGPAAECPGNCSIMAA